MRKRFDSLMENKRKCGNCGEDLEKNDVEGIVKIRDSKYYLCGKCASPLQKSIEWQATTTEPGEWNFVVEGKWNTVEGDRL